MTIDYMTIEHNCPCGATFDVEVVLDDDGDEIEPGACPECGEDLAQSEIVERAIKVIEDLETDRRIQRAEDRNEARHL